MGTRGVDQRSILIAGQRGESTDRKVDVGTYAEVRFPRSFEDFIGHVVPELQSRGLAQTEYAPVTLRDNIFSEGPGL